MDWDELGDGKDLRIAVLGDIIIDEHVTCDVLGISPEDDVAPKLRVSSRCYKLGGAANVALNLKGLGVGHVHLFGCVGEPSHPDCGHLAKMCHFTGINLHLTVNPEYKMPLKTRYMTHRGRYVARIDDERPCALGEGNAQELLGKIKENGPFKYMVVSDYNKGVVVPYLMDKLPKAVPVIVDPKGTDWIRRYGPVFAITPNRDESKELENGCYAKHAIVTCGAFGCFLRGHYGETRFKVRARDMGDPTGCGDSFVAGLVRALAAGVDIAKACRIANAAAACAYDQVGVHAVTLDEVKQEWGTFNY